MYLNVYKYYFVRDVGTRVGQQGSLYILDGVLIWMALFNMRFFSEGTDK